MTSWARTHARRRAHVRRHGAKDPLPPWTTGGILGFHGRPITLARQSEKDEAGRLRQARGFKVRKRAGANTGAEYRPLTFGQRVRSAILRLFPTRRERMAFQIEAREKKRVERAEAAREATEKLPEEPTA